MRGHTSPAVFDGGSGRCAAILSNGKRCPNAALPGSRYCGVPAHQEMAANPPEEAPAEAVTEEATPEEAEALEPVAQVAGEEPEAADEAADQPLAADRQEDETPA